MTISSEHDKVSNDGVMTGQRRRRLTNITPGSCPVLRGYCNVVSILTRCLRRRPKVITTLGENAVFSVLFLFTCSLTHLLNQMGGNQVPYPHMVSIIYSHLPTDHSQTKYRHV